MYSNINISPRLAFATYSVDNHIGKKEIIYFIVDIEKSFKRTILLSIVCKRLLVTYILFGMQFTGF